MIYHGFALISCLVMAQTEDDRALIERGSWPWRRRRSIRLAARANIGIRRANAGAGPTNAFLEPALICSGQFCPSLS